MQYARSAHAVQTLSLGGNHVGRRGTQEYVRAASSRLSPLHPLYPFGIRCRAHRAGCNCMIQKPYPKAAHKRSRVSFVSSVSSTQLVKPFGQHLDILWRRSQTQASEKAWQSSRTLCFVEQHELYELMCATFAQRGRSKVCAQKDKAVGSPGYSRKVSGRVVIRPAADRQIGGSNSGRLVAKSVSEKTQSVCFCLPACLPDRLPG